MVGLLGSADRRLDDWRTRVRGTIVFIVLWILGRIASGYLLYGLLFAPYLAVLDIALVVTIFKGDVRLG